MEVKETSLSQQQQQFAIATLVHNSTTSIPLLLLPSQLLVFLLSFPSHGLTSLISSKDNLGSLEGLHSKRQATYMNVAVRIKRRVLVIREA